MHELEKDQHKVAEASEEARLLSARAIERLGQGTVQIQSSLAQLQSRLGNSVIVAPEAYGEQAQSLQEHMALFAAVSQAVIEYQFFVGNRLPTKKRDNKADVFDWSLGSGRIFQCSPTVNV